MNGEQFRTEQKESTVGSAVITVNSKPYIMMAGEVHNSNSSSTEAMEPIWQKAKKLNMNTLLLPVTWEMLEPEEGQFEFRLVDGLIAQARECEMHIVFLWFGAWKNAQCYYAPAWVKCNPERFWRAEVQKGKKKVNLEKFHGMPYTTLSSHCEETLQADSRAFAMLMKHIKEVDEKEHTVIAVQVENEPGLQGAAREHSDYADELFGKEVPSAFVAYMRENTATMRKDVKAAVEQGQESGSWEEVFGTAAEEIFHTYSVAGYIDRVAEAGKKEYNLPMTVNAWLDKGQEPGMFPSGGPVARMMEVWNYRAPHIDVLAPDIYVQNFCEVCEEYTKMGNPLFIPETAVHSHVAPRLVYVIGHHHAIGFVPFGFEDMGQPFSATDSYLFGVDTSDPLLSVPQDIEEYAWYGHTLNSMMSLLTSRYGTGELQAVISEQPEQDMMIFGQYGFKILMAVPFIPRKDGMCLALQIAENEFYLIANGCMIAPFSTNPEKPHVDILSLEEGEFRDGVWHMTRRLNGDEVASMRYDKPTLLKIKLFSYQ